MAVVGVQDTGLGERVVAVVKARPGTAVPTLVDIRRHLSSSLAPYKHPRELHVVGDIPRNALGKV